MEATDSSKSGRAAAIPHLSIYDGRITRCDFLLFICIDPLRSIHNLMEQGEDGRS